MGLWDILGDAKDSIDRSRQAREYINQAKQYVREGEEIYNKAYNKVNSYAFETERKLREHTAYKKKIAQELDSNIGDIVENFRQFDIDSKIINAAPIQNVQISEKDINVFSSTMQACITPVGEFSILDMFISDEDYYEAKRQKDEARQYKEQMKYEREKLNNYKEKMSEVCSFINTERSELDSLMDKIRKMTKELDIGMKKNSLLKEEADYLKGIHKITECIIELLSTQFLSDMFSITEKYQKVFKEIKNINESLPYAPSITDKNTLVAMKRILDGVIVY